MTNAQLTAVTVSMPSLGENVPEGTVTRWLKQPGDHVDADEPLLEVATDKVDTEIPSPHTGTLREILADEDTVVAIGDPLASIDTASGDGPSETINSAAPVATPPTAERPPSAPLPPKTDARPSALPVQPAAAVPTQPRLPSGSMPHTERLPRIRQTIARRMVESLQTSAQLTTVVEVDVTNITRLRAQQVWEQVRRTYVTECGGRWPADAQNRLMGMSTPEWARYLSEEAGVGRQPEEVATAVVAQMAHRYAEDLPLIPGALEALARLGDLWPLGLASSSTTPSTIGNLNLVAVLDHVVEGESDDTAEWLCVEQDEDCLAVCLRQVVGGESGFESVFHCTEEACGVGAVDDAVIVGDGEVGHRAHADAPGAVGVGEGDDAVEDGTSAEDPGLGLVDDGSVEQRAAAASVGEGEGPTTELVGGDLPGPNAFGNVGDRASESADAKVLGVADHRNHEAFVAVDGHAEVVGDLRAVRVQGCVEHAVRTQCLDCGLREER